jgi:hypothetical protein
MRITCPECGAGLKSSAGFKPGQAITCPKCETAFEVEEPEPEPVRPAKKAAPPSAGFKKPARAAVAAVEDDEDEDERPKKKKKKKKRAADEDEEGWSYKSSWIRFAVLGVLLVVLGVLGFLLYQKQQREKQDAAAPTPDTTNTDVRPRPDPPLVAGGPKGLPVGDFGGGPIGKAAPGNPPAGFPGNPPAGGGFGLPFGGATNPAETRRLTDELTRKLVGAWKAQLPDGSTHEVEYKSDGTYTESVTGGTNARGDGKYTVRGLIGTKGLRLNRPIGGRTQVMVIFEGDELLHDTHTPGVTGVFRRQQ